MKVTWNIEKNINDVCSANIVFANVWVLEWQIKLLFGDVLLDLSMIVCVCARNINELKKKTDLYFLTYLRGRTFVRLVGPIVCWTLVRNHNAIVGRKENKCAELTGNFKSQIIMWFYFAPPATHIPCDSYLVQLAFHWTTKSCTWYSVHTYWFFAPQIIKEVKS